MNDRKLLESAAKAMEIDVRWIDEWNGFFIHRPHKLPGEWPMWNPLTDDGDALRLAVKLNMSMDLFDDEILVACTPNDNEGMQVSEDPKSGPYAATRRAIVRAAAEIGKAMEEIANDCSNT